MTRSVLVSIAKATLSIGLVVGLVWATDMKRLWDLVAACGTTGPLVALALLVLQALLLSSRWQRLLVMLGVSLPTALTTRWVFVGLFFNQALPTSVGGDAVRIWLVHRRGAPPGAAFASVAIERVTGIALLGMLVSACLPSVWQAYAPPVRLVLAAVGPGLLLLLFALAFADALPARRVPARLAAALSGLAQGLRRLARSPADLTAVVGLGVAASLCGLGAAFVLARDLGITATLPEMIVVVGGAVLVSVLPVSLGGWGVREVSIVALFGALGVAPERALAVSLLWGALQLVVALPGGLAWWLDDRGRSGAPAAEPAHRVGLPQRRGP